ncbi:MAG: hypothetical protein V7607_976 [Solirubrobacteraceae bacterium]
MRRITWPGAALAALLATAVLGGTAQAAQSGWQCGATAASSSFAGNPVFNPVTTSASPCVSNATGADTLPDSVGAPPSAIDAKTSSATTIATPADEIAANQSVAGIGRVENLALRLPPGVGTVVLGVREANASATGACVNGSPVLDGSSEVDGVTLGGQEIPVDQAAKQLGDQLGALGMVVDLKFDERVRSAGSLTIRALHLRVLAAAGTPILDVIAGEARTGYSGAVCDPTGQTPGGGTTETFGGARSAASRLFNGVRGSTCARLRMRFARNHKTTYASRLGKRTVVRGRIVNCKGKSIVRARIDVVHVVNGKRRLVKTGLRSRAGGNLTLILPLNIKTRDLRFEYRGNLLSTKVTSRSTLHITVRNRKGKVVH